jgi:hypothetical protein
MKHIPRRGTMNKIYLMLCLLFVSSIASGGEVIREKGDVSLNFSFNGLAISNYKYGIGTKYWMTPNIAVVGSLDTGNQKYVSKTDFNSGGSTDMDLDSRYFGLSLGLEKHLKSRKNISPYVGAEARYFNEHGSTKSVQSSGASTSIMSSDYTVRGYGLYAVLGVEYTLNEYISLAADYSYGYGYMKRMDSSADLSAPVGETTSKGFSLCAGRLALLVYF